MYFPLIWSNIVELLKQSLYKFQETHPGFQQSKTMKCAFRWVFSYLKRVQLPFCCWLRQYCWNAHNGNNAYSVSYLCCLSEWVLVIFTAKVSHYVKLLGRRPADSLNVLIEWVKGRSTLAKFSPGPPDIMVSPQISRTGCLQWCDILSLKVDINLYSTDHTIAISLFILQLFSGPVWSM